MTREALSLLTDAATRSAFEAVAQERRIRFRELLEVLDVERTEALEALSRLATANLIKFQEVPEEVEDFRSYYVTEEGLSAERELDRLEELAI